MTRLRVAPTAGLAAAVLLLAACGGTPAPAATSTVTAPVVTVTVAVPAPASAQPSTSDTPPGSPTTTTRPATVVTPAARTNALWTDADLDAAVTRLDDATPGSLGVALTPVGGGTTVVGGRERADLAWSTIKVPIAVAALQVSGSQSTHDLARRAITASDNSAASALYARTSAGGVDSVLRAGGDAHTATNASRFGLTAWRIEDQSRFAASLPCRSEAAAVYELMGQIDPSQQWGLGTIDGTRFKGGWGDQTDGSLSRQLGVVPLGSRGAVAVSIVSRTPAGGVSANRDLDALARMLRDNADRLPAGRC